MGTRWRLDGIALAVLLMWSAGSVACGDPVGTPCETVGSGFTAKDPCRHKCLSRWQINCPGGESISPGVCTGAFGCEPGSCPAGQVCYSDDDPFDDRSFCVPETVCGDLSPEALAGWELSSLERQREVIEERRKKEARKAAWQAEQRAAGKDPSAPTAEAQAPSAEPLAAEPLAAEPLAAEPLSDEASPPTRSNDPSAATTDQPSANASANASAASLPSLPCEATAERLAVPILGPDSSVSVALSAGVTFEQALPQGWRFVLQPVEGGWWIQVLDRPEAAGAIDLSAVTPPWRGPTNPRQILGWHFRNADNTAPNTGEVNAPQELRLFQFDPELTGTGGFRPPQDGSEPVVPGRGWLRIDTLDLSPPAAGERAQILDLTFQACLTWPRPKPADEERWRQALETSRAAASTTSAAVDPLDVELLGACGGEAAGLDVEARVSPPSWQLDIDGDGSFDHVLQAVRRTDGAHGLAICRAGTWLDFLAPGHLLVSEEAVESTISAMEAWWVVDGDHGAFGFVDEPPWPAMDGQALVVERVEKSRVLLFWSDDQLRAQTVYRYVEP